MKRRKQKQAQSSIDVLRQSLDDKLNAAEAPLRKESQLRRREFLKEVFDVPENLTDEQAEQFATEQQAALEAKQSEFRAMDARLSERHKERLLQAGFTSNEIDGGIGSLAADDPRFSAFRSAMDEYERDWKRMKAAFGVVESVGPELQQDSLLPKAGFGPIASQRTAELVREKMGKSDPRPPDNLQIRILEWLSDCSAPQKQVDVAAAVDASQKTVGDRLRELEDSGFVDRPLGERSGFAITEAGRRFSLSNAPD